MQEEMRQELGRPCRFLSLLGRKAESEGEGTDDLKGVGSAHITLRWSGRSHGEGADSDT